MGEVLNLTVLWSHLPLWPLFKPLCFYWLLRAYLQLKLVVHGYFFYAIWSMFHSIMLLQSVGVLPFPCRTPSRPPTACVGSCTRDQSPEGSCTTTAYTPAATEIKRFRLDRNRWNCTIRTINLLNIRTELTSGVGKIPIGPRYTRNDENSYHVRTDLRAWSEHERTLPRTVEGLARRHVILEHFPVVP